VTFQHILLTIVLALGAANPAFAQTSQDFIYSRRVNSDPTRLLQQGMALLRSNHNEEAAEKFERLCAINPNSARAHYFWGLSLLKLGRTVEATDQLKQAIRIDSQLADAWLTLAGIYQATGDTDQAIRTYREFVSRFPQDNDAQRAGGLLALLTKQNSIGQSNNDSVTASPSNGFNNPAILPTPNSAAMNQPARLPTTDTQVAAQPDYYPEIIAHGLMRWTSQQMPLAVFIDSDYPRKGTATNYPAVLKAAFLDWASKSQGFVNFVFTPGLPKANIVCRWSEDCSKFNSNGEAAETRLYGSQSGLARGEIEILVLSPLAKTPLTEEQMRGIALHEIGHVLGLAGHSKNQDDIMFFSPYKVDYWHGISSRDQATLARLYSQK
jgi:tetratricopeptide (TPR) repeat protein